MEFENMTPVQSSVIPLFLSHKDVVAEAVTGSGKTLAFVIPIIEMLQRRDTPLKKHELGAVVVCPTRELAQQIASVFSLFLEKQPTDTKRAPLRGVKLCVGGTSVSPEDDFNEFREHGHDILVGTPGRMEELLRKPGIRTGELDVLVMDEADRLLDLGFAPAIRTIIGYLPKQRRTGLFSATMTEALSELVRVGLRNPVRVVVKVEFKNRGASKGKDIRMPATLQSFYHVSRPENKFAQLLRLLRYEAQGTRGARKAIVYFATCAQVNYVFSLLQALDKGTLSTAQLRFFSLHGKQTPKRRTATFSAFAQSRMGDAGTDATGDADAPTSVLLCTDVAARGLDLPDVDVVIQYDPPSDPKVFNHRSGRTARAGKSGRAIVMLHAGREEGYVEFLEIKQLPLQRYRYLVETDAALEQGVEPDSRDAAAQALENKLRACVRRDRALYELGMRAFVSWVKAYSKHEVSYIFRLTDLPLGAMACEFALLNLPRMPELRSWHNDGALFQDDMPDREQQRLAALSRKEAETKEHKEPRKRTKTVAWSEQKKKKETRDLRREKKERKRRWLREQEQAEAPASSEDEEDDWGAEERAAKKLKKGGMSQEAFDNEFFDRL